MEELELKAGMKIIIEEKDTITGEKKYGFIELEEDGKDKFKSKTDEWIPLTKEEMEALKNDGFSESNNQSRKE